MLFLNELIFTITLCPNDKRLAFIVATLNNQALMSHGT